MLSYGGIKFLVKNRRRTLFHRFEVTLLFIKGVEDLFCPPLLLVVLLEHRKPFHVIWRILGGLGGFTACGFGTKLWKPLRWTHFHPTAVYFLVLAFAQKTSASGRASVPTIHKYIGCATEVSLCTRA